MSTEEGGEGQDGNEEGGGGDPWTASIEDAATREWVEGKGFKDVGAALSSYHHLERLTGAEKAGRTIIKPGRDATDDEVSAYRESLGWPKDAADYEIPMPETGGDEKLAEAFRGIFHEEGLSTDQARGLTEKWNAYQESLQTQANEAAALKEAEDEAALKLEWGAALDKNMKMARDAAAHLGVDGEMVDAIQKAAGYAKTMKFFQDVGARLGEDTFADGGTADSGGVMSPAEAKAKLNALSSDREHMAAWTDRGHPGHKDAVARKSALTRLAYPEA